MSRSVEDDIREFTSSKPVRYTPHPLYDIYGESIPRNLALKHFNLADDGTNYLLFFGFIRDYKGLDLLLQAMADPRIRNMPLKLIVAGEYYGNQEDYEELIRVLDIADQLVLRTDFIPASTMRR